ncbi:hypothetical protein CEXT_71881 [Caerostris extrusa]|uniref:Uncharacterized protein n=1 Tax=Caerostris extrusa TaxID=172846 RepID=A0AAV4QCC8_CAEEX|nr:hypothetical protein CEXT_71881 [Caerostris extrusa]
MKLNPSRAIALDKKDFSGIKKRSKRSEGKCALYQISQANKGTNRMKRNGKKGGEKEMDLIVQVILDIP